ncbi:MAG: NAD-dependent epimerase/dehydratase family protein [Acidobacteria bacterium]|nr:MAG: NAD-dependent epimerase/dehydratase family protein [Acidobacteriota bacterium]
MKSSCVLVTGGAGFIGSNLVNRLIGEGHRVTILDNLTRSGCEQNLDWLRSVHGPHSFQLIRGDVSDYSVVVKAAKGAQRIYHLAGQVAVTTSVTDPRADFQANALGTFNVLEAARQVADNPILLYASTNKVYGGMEGVRIVEDRLRYQYADLPFGVSEDQPLDFHSPYGCSKGAGDQYTRDYARIYGLRTVVVRQSCIYGYRQFGIEDQGWVAWFVIAALKGLPISIYGNGKQVRDVLFIDDLLDGYDAVVRNIDRVAGQVYNLGGGAANTISIWTEFRPLLEKLAGHRISACFGDWRPGDQPVYVSDIRKAERDLGWRPRIGVKEGIGNLFAWASHHLHLFDHLGEPVAAE